MSLQFKRYEVGGVGKLIKDSKRRHTWTFSRLGEPYTVVAVDSIVSHKFRVNIQKTMLYDAKITEDQKKRGLEFEFANMTIKIKKMTDNRCELFVDLHRFVPDKTINESIAEPEPKSIPMTSSSIQYNETFLKFKRQTEQVNTDNSDKKKQSVAPPRATTQSWVNTQPDKNFNDLLIFNDDKDASSEDDFHNFGESNKMKRTTTDVARVSLRKPETQATDFDAGFKLENKSGLMKSKTNVVGFKDVFKPDAKSTKMVDFGDDFLNFDADHNKPVIPLRPSKSTVGMVSSKDTQQFNAPLQPKSNAFLAEPQALQQNKQKSMAHLANKGFLNNDLFDKHAKEQKDTGSVPSESKKKGFDFDFNFGNTNEKPKEPQTPEVVTRPQAHTMPSLPKYESTEKLGNYRQTESSNNLEKSSSQVFQDPYAVLNKPSDRIANPFDEEHVEPVNKPPTKFLQPKTSNDDMKNYSFNHHKSLSNGELDTHSDNPTDNLGHSTYNITPSEPEAQQDKKESNNIDGLEKFEMDGRFDFEDISPIKGEQMHEPDFYKQNYRDQHNGDNETFNINPNVNLSKKFAFGDENFNPFDTDSKGKQAQDVDDYMF